LFATVSALPHQHAYDAPGGGTGQDPRPLDLTSRAQTAPKSTGGSPFCPPAPNSPEAEVVDLQPCPDAYLRGLALQEPGTIYDLRESGAWRS
jgi:hypothetical protein